MNGPLAIRAALALVLALGSARASAQPAAPPASPAPLPPPLVPTNADFERRLSELEKSNAELRAKVADLKGDQDDLSAKIQKVLPLTGRIGGYVDFGFFYVGGDGSGIRPDLDHTHYPRFRNVPDTWTFLGDPLSTAINSRGDPADTGPSRAITFDPVGNGGKASFIVNNVNLQLFAALGETLTVNAMIDFVPRGRNVSKPDELFVGDYIDAKLAYVEFIAPIEAFKLSLYAGKIDSVLGYEYRVQESPDRLTVTPSLICRYTCGRPLGLKTRAQFFHDVLTVALAATNGSSVIEGFPFYDEIDTNNAKTGSGRVSVTLPVGAGLEIGASGAAGAQDFQTSDSVLAWHYGFDVHLDWHGLELFGEFVQGHDDGKTERGQLPCNAAPCLHYKGAYGLAGYRLFNWLEPYARVDWRDALHQSGANFTYISKVARVTGGLRSEIGTAVILKAEYVLNRELGNIPQFPDDVFTSSLVVKY